MFFQICQRVGQTCRVGHQQQRLLRQRPLDHSSKKVFSKFLAKFHNFKVFSLKFIVYNIYLFIYLFIYYLFIYYLLFYIFIYCDNI